jgi:hypothetical protein
MIFVIFRDSRPFSVAGRHRWGAIKLSEGKSDTAYGPMEFFRFKNIPSRHRGDVTFRYPAGPGFLVHFALAGAFSAAYTGVGPAARITPLLPPHGPELLAACAVLLCLAGVSRAFAAFNPRVRWLARITRKGLLVKFRSHRNHGRLSRADVVAVLIPWSEVTQVRPTGPSGNEGVATHLEVRLKGEDLFPLRMHLANERGRKAPLRRRWWGGRTSPSLAPHHPVQLTSDGVLRIEWKVRPSLRRAVELCRRRLADTTAAAPPGATPETTGTAIPSPETVQQIVHMARSGEMLGAFMAAAEAYHVSEAEAERLVEALVTGQLDPESPKGASGFLVKPVPRDLLLDLAAVGDVRAIERALVKDHGFSPAEAAGVGAALFDLPPAAARQRLVAALDKGPAPRT